jgi:BMFP domain-containing protein YqiC
MKPVKILDDLAQMAGGAVSIASNLRTQIHQDIKARVEEMADRLDLVPREDFERLEAMLKEYRLTQDDLLKRIEKLEKGTTTKAAPKKKAAAKTTKAKTTKTAQGKTTKK